MGAGPRLALAVLLSLGAIGGALAQSNNSSATKKAPPKTGAAKPSAKVQGSFGSWTLLCGKEGKNKKIKERCSLVLPLVEKNTQKLVFRMILGSCGGVLTLAVMGACRPRLARPQA